MSNLARKREKEVHGIHMMAMHHRDRYMHPPLSNLGRSRSYAPPLLAVLKGSCLKILRQNLKLKQNFNVSFFFHKILENRNCHFKYLLTFLFENPVKIP
jgi:hypothetical protein